MSQKKGNRLKDSCPSLDRRKREMTFGKTAHREFHPMKTGVIL
jgi:hypothetical protein